MTEGNNETDRPEAQSVADDRGALGTVTMGGIGWTLLLGGAAVAAMGAMQSIPSLALIAGGSLAVNAGFFCVLFGWLGDKIDGLKGR